MATQNRKRSTDEDDEGFAYLFAEGDSPGTRCQKLKDAYTTLQDDCKQQRQEGACKNFQKET